MNIRTTSNPDKDPPNPFRMAAEMDPFEALDRVRALAEFWESRTDGTPEEIGWTQNAAVNLRAALDG